MYLQSFLLHALTFLLFRRNIIRQISIRRRSLVLNARKTVNSASAWWLHATCGKNTIDTIIFMLLIPTCSPIDAKRAESIFTKGRNSTHGKKMSWVKHTWACKSTVFISNVRNACAKSPSRYDRQWRRWFVGILNDFIWIDWPCQRWLRVGTRCNTQLRIDSSGRKAGQRRGNQISWRRSAQPHEGQSQEMRNELI